MQKIAIIGGGLVGTSLAISLDQQASKYGWHIDLFEAMPFKSSNESPSFDGRSSAISYGTFQIYKELGLDEKFLQGATPIKQIEVSDRDKKATTNIYAKQENVEALGFMVANAWLGETLWTGLNSCKNVTINAPETVDSIKFTQDGAILQTLTNKQYAANLVVLVDGGASGLKDKLGISNHSEDYGQKAIFAGVELSQNHNNIAYERFVENGAIALLPTANQTAALVWTQASDQADELLNLNDADFLQALQKAFGARAGIFKGISARGFYPLKLLVAKEQARKNLVLLGNAAHYLHPVAGQGYNLAIRGVKDLVQHLVYATQAQKPLGDLNSLLAYVKARKQDQQEVIGFSHGLIKLFESEHGLLTFGRNLGLKSLNKTPNILSFIAKKAMGLRS